MPYSKPPVSVDNVNLLEKLVTQAFSQRRKTLRNTLKPLMNAEQIEAQGVDPRRRAETLSLTEFALLANFVSVNAVTQKDKTN